MAFDANSALRHTPKQSRGQRKVEHILRSAEALFAEVGFENATTNAIATRAGVSIGSLYQFFASKEAILHAMAERYLSQTRVALTEQLSYDEPQDAEALLTKILETLIKLQEQRPYFLQCLSRSQPSHVLTEPVQAFHEEFAEVLKGILQRSTNETDAKVLSLRALIFVDTVGILLPHAVRNKGRARSLAVTEIRSMLMGYLAPTLKVKGMI
ncbi:MAG: regulatory protein TetR [Candidatus Saccharibacteria bacterium]|jgi:AcrR family transcriptional regulator|nr:regulatory protein TetR [Candidatus Saccharibacteria bacterium]